MTDTLDEELAVAAAARGEAGDHLDVGVGLDTCEQLAGGELDVIGEFPRDLAERGQGAGRGGHRGGLAGYLRGGRSGQVGGVALLTAVAVAGGSWLLGQLPSGASCGP